MDTNRLKKFAVEARNKIKAGVEAKLSTLGFDAKGKVPDSMKPQLMQGGSLWNGQLMTEGFYHQWMALYEAVRRHGVRDVYEEAAYTWFNRLVAIRILQKNGLIEPVLSYAEDGRTPQIVDDARSAGRIPPMDEADRKRLMELLDDDTKVTEQFAILITAYCHNNAVIRSSFGRMADYTELLLPNNILADGGFIDDLNHTEFITDDDYKSSELIGWLYQFYISERKDEVFAKKGKYEPDEIAPATQIFTPHWIVEYMVQNTVGRIYLDKHPEAEPVFKPKWKYLVENGKAEEDTAEDEDVAKVKEMLKKFGLNKESWDGSLETLRCADLAPGSGHILGYMFDLLYDLYIYEGYTRREAVESILTNNLYGCDIDLRANQLATFALLLKACQKDSTFSDAHVLPNVITMPDLWQPVSDANVATPTSAGAVPCAGPKERRKLLKQVCSDFVGTYEENAADWLVDEIMLIDDAQTLGSIMKFLDDDDYVEFLQATYKEWIKDGLKFVPADIQSLLPYVRLILVLSQKYHAIVMNPPYMGSSRFDAVLSKYVKDNYPDGKADLFAVFMLVCQDRLVPNGKYAMINMQSWMFLSSFEDLREDLLESYQIESMLHLGPHTFNELGGEVVQNVAFVVANHNPNATGTYYRLVDGKDCADKKRIFLANKDANVSVGAKVYYPNIKQSNFDRIPRFSLGYWVSKEMLNDFSTYKSLSEIALPCVGIQTGNNNKFLLLWCEINSKEINYSCSSHQSSIASALKWYPYNKGGARKWYGNRDLVVNWYKDGYDIRNYDGSVLRNQSTYFKESITFPRIGSNHFYSRFSPKGAIYDINGPSCFPVGGDLYYILALMNSNVMNDFAKILCPTVTFQIGDIFLTPYINYDKKESINAITKNNIAVSKQDWDAHETSWDFEMNPLVEMAEIVSGQPSADKLEVSNRETNSFSIENKQFSTEKQTVFNKETNDVSVEGQNENSEEDTTEYLNKSSEQLHEDYRAAVKDEADYTLGTPTLSQYVETFKKVWKAKFDQLHTNEEELNRQFIDIYGLQDELTPDVPKSEITILQQGEITVNGDDVKWNDDVLIKQLISYLVGICMGRYRLDKPGLHIAYPNPSEEDTAAYDYNGHRIIIDDDGIIPLMSRDCPFPDNMLQRLSDLVSDIFGTENLTLNLNFMEKALGETLEKYLMKDFWKDHKKRYQNRPIYWLFSSKKGAFQCIAYMHRMNAYTAERVRSKYLLPYIEYLQRTIDSLDARSAELTTAENRKRENLRKQLEECREYHERLQVVAEQAINFDLDDGVVVNYAKFGDVLAKIK
ncbi:MAG: BREX-1 system adenine-specific DNA-methyltransferase PglX [Prevotella sp.]